MGYSRHKLLLALTMMNLSVTKLISLAVVTIRMHVKNIRYLIIFIWPTSNLYI